MADVADYIGDVQKYDSGASEAHVKKIMNYCGIALQNKDSSLVSCSDETERNRVRDGFAAKKLGMSAGDADTAIAAICETMKGDRMKQRVTFLYLLAKGAGKLDY